MGSSASKRKQEELATAIQNGWVKAVREILSGFSAARCSQALPEDEEAKALREMDLNAPLPSGYTALQLAASRGLTDIVRLLLDFDAEVLGVEPNAFGSQKRTALHFAAASRKVKCVAELLQHGADPFIAAADDGKTPLDVARNSGCPRCVRCLEAAVLLWDGWVDHFERRMLVVPTWKAKRLVVLRDRRPNTGPPGRGHLCSRPCAGCGAVQPLPPLVAQFKCPRCGTTIPVPAMLQMVTYELSPGACEDDDIDVNINNATVAQLPQDPSQILLSEQLGALQSAVSSKRSYNFSVKILDATQKLLAEHCFRFTSSTERQQLFDILRDPQHASLEAEAASFEPADNEYLHLEELPEPSAPPQSFLVAPDAWNFFKPDMGEAAPASAPTSAPTSGASVTVSPPIAVSQEAESVYLRCSVFPCGGPIRAGSELLFRGPCMEQAVAGEVESACIRQGDEPESPAAEVPAMLATSRPVFEYQHDVEPEQNAANNQASLALASAPLAASLPAPPLLTLPTIRAGLPPTSTPQLEVLQSTASGSIVTIPGEAGTDSAESMLHGGPQHRKTLSSCPESQTTEWQQPTAAPSSGTWSSQVSLLGGMQQLPEPPPLAPGTLAARYAPAPPPAAPLPWN